MKKAPSKHLERATTLSFRTSEPTKRQVATLAGRRGLSSSDWLRETVETAVNAELGLHPPKGVADG